MRLFLLTIIAAVGLVWIATLANSMSHEFGPGPVVVVACLITASVLMNRSKKGARK